jgi:GNAT superfamily N-acetyltransferase
VKEKDRADSSWIDRVAFHEVDQDRWSDFERLFESKGGPKYCWCMAWRANAEGTKQTGDGSKKAMMAGRVAAGVPVGILGYLDGEPIAWCSVAPRSTHRRLVDDASPDEGVWSITCFFVVRRLRGQGIVRRILDAAVEHARSRGATVVEAYPVAPDSPSYRFMGFVPVFEGAGFREVARAGSRRHVMRLQIAAGS